MTRRLPADAGLSLIEILVAVSIMSLVAAAVVLSMSQGPAPIETESRRLTARLHFAGEDAIATGQPVGLVIEDFGTGYSFHRYVDGRWWPVEDNDALARRTLPEQMRLDVLEAIFVPDPDDETPRRVPVFWFDPAGLTEPFSLRLEDAEKTLVLRWTGTDEPAWVEGAG